MMRCLSDFSNLNKSFLVLLALVCLSGCETEIPADSDGAHGPLDIIGSTSNRVYIGAEYNVEFGVKGGQAPYRYRYLKEAPGGYDFEVPDAVNHLDFTIEVTDGAKPAFRLRGLPGLPEDQDFESFSPIKSAFYLEVSDGVNTVVKQYEYTLYQNELTYQGDTKITEGRENLGIYNNAIRNIRRGNDGDYCKTFKDYPFPVVEEVNGYTTYTNIFQVRLSVRHSSAVAFKYRIISNYRETESEIGSNNFDKARPDVDFVVAEGEFEFDPGERICFIPVKAIDDFSIEDEEHLEIEIYDRVGGLVNYEPIATQEVVLIDNEPQVEIDPVDTVVNVGDFVSVPVSLAGESSGQELHFFIDDTETTASSDSFTLVPESGVVVFPADANDATIGVDILSESVDQPLGLDRRIQLTSEVDEYKEFDPSEIVINEWPSERNPDNEIVLLSGDEVAAVALSSDPQGRVYVIKQAENGVGDQYVVVSGYYRNADPYTLLDSSDEIVLAQAGTDIVAKDIVFSDVGDGILSLVTEVNGRVGDFHRGGSDFLVSSYRLDTDGMFDFLGHSQFGTEEDDIVEGVAFKDAKLYVFGQTTGQVFDSTPSEQVNRGGADGFVYRLDMGDDGSRLVWSRFVGGTEDNTVLGFAPGSSQSYALALDGLDGKRSFVQALDSSGLDSDAMEETPELGSTQVHSFKAIDRTDNGNSYFILSHGLRNPSTGSATNSGTQDVALSTFRDSNAGSSSTFIATGANDFAVDLAILDEREVIAVTGYTEGVLDGQLGKGGAQDAFFSVFDIEESADLKSSVQFGTAGVDEPIDLLAIGDDKFLVLWSENHTSGDGSTTYRISAFAPDGRMLSPEP
ncbi:MAG: hypothetical protein C9356_00295 [Oleiphilus sp.]|nr:MAG: hypothetical protein C9356_00295 [Oleiphilus sp.]